MYQEQLEKRDSKPTSPSSETKFLMFENKSNNCWLDASMALVAHNKTLKIMAGCNPASKLYEIINKYAEAITILNDNANPIIELRIKATKEKLLSLQNHTLEYLQPVLKCQNGEPDSAFCALLNLIYENKFIKESLSITWLWRKKCLKCNTSKLTQSSKPIVTLSKVNYFMPDCPTSVYMCSCKTEQEMKLIYKELPPCLFFHFENGAGKGESPPFFFVIQDRKYQLTEIITLEKGEESSVNHFITWIRDPKSNKWLECNDLNSDIVSFISETPLIDLSDVYMYVYESFDKIGKMSIEISADYAQEQDFGNTNVEIIDLSDESEDAKPAVVSPSEKNAENYKESAANDALDSFSKQSAVVPVQEEKLDSVKKKLYKELETSEAEKRQETNIALGMLKETVTQKLNTSDEGKITHALNTSVKQQAAKEINNSAGESKNRECLSISNGGQKKLPVSSSSNVLAKVDSVKTLPSKGEEETKPKVDYAKAIVKNVRFYHQKTTPMFSEAGYKNKFIKASLPTNLPTLLQKKESDKLFKEIKLPEVEESDRITSSDESQITGIIETSRKKNTVACLLEQRKELQVELHAVSHIKNSSLKSGCSEKLDNPELNTSNAKNVLITDLKIDGSSVAGDLKPILEKKSNVEKEKLSDTCSETNKDVPIISNILKVHEHLDASPKIVNKIETFQSDASADKTGILKLHGKFSIFSKGKNRAKTFQNSESDIQVEESSIEINNSPSVKSSNENKRKHSSQQDVSEDGKLVVPTKICKILHKPKIDKNESEGLTGSQEKMPRTSSRKPTKNKKYLTDYYDVSLIPLPIERKNGNKTSVTAVKDQVVPRKDKMVLQKKSARKSAIKTNGVILSDRDLQNIVDVHVNRGLCTFMENILHRRDRVL